MAGLCQNNGTAFLTVSPVSTDKAVAEMFKADVLRCRNVLNPADLSLLNQAMDRGMERRIAQHMTHHDDPSAFLCLFPDLDAFFQIRGNGLFQQQMVTFFQCRNCISVMILILCGDDHYISHFRLIQKFFTGYKAVFRRNTICIHRNFTLGVPGIRHGNDFHILRVSALVNGISIATAAAKAADGEGDSFFHVNLSNHFFFYGIHGTIRDPLSIISEDHPTEQNTLPYLFWERPA